MFKKIFSLSILSLFCAASLFAQDMASLEQQALAAGYTQAQIEQYKEQMVTGNSSSSLSSAAVVSPNVVKGNDFTRSIEQDSLIQAREAALAAKEKTDGAISISKTRFGQQIFNNSKLTFELPSNMATPSNYIIGGGDGVIVEVWGDVQLTYDLIVTPDGDVTIPNLGVVNIASLTLDKATAKVKQRLNTIYSNDDNNINVKLSISKIRTINVNVAGEANLPGSFSLPSLSTLFNALYYAAGVNDIGTLRNIKLFRDGKLVTTLDIYNYILKGDVSSNVQLQDNDMIIIEPYANLVAVRGGVKREMVYELKEGETLSTLIGYAGGFRGDAFEGNVTISRKTSDNYQLHTVINDNFAHFAMQDGDLVDVKSSISKFDNKISIVGAVWRDGDYQISPQTNSVLSLIEAAGGIKGDAFLNRAQITRVNSDYSTQMISFDLKELLNKTAPDIELQPDDKLYIPSVYDINEKQYVKVYGAVNGKVAVANNRAFVPEVSDSLQAATHHQQSDRFDFSTPASPFVTRSSSENTFQFAEGMTVEDAILLAGGLQESASSSKLIVARRVKNNSATEIVKQRAEQFEFAISKDLALKPADKSFKLEAFDEIFVMRSPGYSEQKKVVVVGEVPFPGSYVLLERGERLSSLLERAGGFTSEAYPKGLRIVRRKSDDEISREIKMQEVSKQASASGEEVILTTEIDSLYAVGIDIEAALKNKGSIDDPVLRDDDIIYIPELTNTVKISGAVLHPNTVTYIKGENYRHYVKSAGWYVQRARRKPYIVYMNGSAAKAKRRTKIEPGCEIIVPMKAASINQLGVQGWLSAATSVTSIAAMAAALVASL